MTRTTTARPLGIAIAGSLLLAACASAPAPVATPPEDAFLAQLRTLCGQAFEGRIVANEPAPTTSDAFVGKRLVMHVRECAPDAIRIPFHVGDDRSRTWVLTRTAAGLRLQHDHRHADGSADAVTMYGGDSTAPGSEARQRFPADAATIALFQREGLAPSVTNVWTLELEPESRFSYELTRPGRRFRVEFDLSWPITPPPPPWGR